MVLSFCGREIEKALTHSKKISRNINAFLVGAFNMICYDSIKKAANHFGFNETVITLIEMMLKNGTVNFLNLWKAGEVNEGCPQVGVTNCKVKVNNTKVDLEHVQRMVLITGVMKSTQTRALEVLMSIPTSASFHRTRSYGHC